MDNQSYRVLEFTRVLEMAANYAVTEPAKGVVQGKKPYDSIDEVRRQVSLVSECRHILSEGRSLGIEHFSELSSIFKRVRPTDSVIEPVELRAFLPLMLSALNLQTFNSDPSCKGLSDIVSHLSTHPDIRKSVDRSIDREGMIRDNASPRLASVRKSIKSFESKIKIVLDGLLKRDDLIPHLQDFYITQRNNRWVIPVKKDFKGSVPGVVHDISNTGETVFIEPYAVQQIGNELESLGAEEKLEEYRILRDLTALIRENLYDIEADYAIVTEVDSLQALARFSDKMDMSCPEVNEKGHMKIVRGMHPILWKALKKEHRESEIVPLDIEIGRGLTGMVITGSNAGGKTVALKTIGILNLMALSGMHVPAGSGTVIPFLDGLYADIGDDQSIDQNLSTFSAHVTRISDIIKRSGKNTLVIVDELGTGTDPEQGGALSCAILKQLKMRETLTIVSTHLGMLKAFAHSERGIINCAMEMKEVDVNGAAAYKPTYKLVVGEPGTSHAFEIAESLGLHPEIIKEARHYLSGQDGKIESLISDLKEKNRAADRKILESEKLKNEANEIRSAVEKELSEINSSKQGKLTKALSEARDIIQSARTEARDIIDELKKTRAAEAKKALSELNKKDNEFKKAQDRIDPLIHQKLKEVTEGQSVYIKSLGIMGTVRRVNEKAGKSVVVVAGKEISIPLKDLYEPEQKQDTEKQESSSEHIERMRRAASYLSVDSDMSSEIKLIGIRVEPAISMVERYLNDASLADMGQVKIIHGIGTGKLSYAIREYLNNHPLVENSRRGEEEEGGDAVTVVTL